MRQERFGAGPRQRRLQSGGAVGLRVLQPLLGGPPRGCARGKTPPDPNAFGTMKTTHVFGMYARVWVCLHVYLGLLLNSVSLFFFVAGFFWSCPRGDRFVKTGVMPFVPRCCVTNEPLRDK